MEKYAFLMSVYKKENPDYLKLSIESMVNQTAKPTEIVIVKDGPITDELQKVIDYYIEKYGTVFNVVGYEENRGLAFALNYGLEKCNCELVARMDSDDYSCPDRCEIQLKEFDENPKLDLVGTGIKLFEKYPDEPSNKIKTYPKEKAEMEKIIRRDSAFAHVSVMFKKSSVIRAGWYDPKLRLGQDHDLFSRMIYKNFNMYNIDKPLVLVRADENLKLRRKNKTSCDTRIAIQKRLLKRKQCTVLDYLYIWLGVTSARIMPPKLFMWLYSFVKNS